MAIKEALLPEFDHEMGTTRRLLERLPESELSWKPHAKSMSLGGLATHLTQIPQWVGTIVNESYFDLATPGVGPAPELKTRSDILSTFDKHVAQARAQMAGKSDPELMMPWSLKQGDKELFTLPRIAALRSFLLNHSIHHRGQLSVYLRLKDVPVPSIYGPSADESPF
jgi:uncharacterized damage-inducible protein DinB